MSRSTLSSRTFLTSKKASLVFIALFFMLSLLVGEQGGVNCDRQLRSVNRAKKSLLDSDSKSSETFPEKRNDTVWTDYIVEEDSNITVVGDIPSSADMKTNPGGSAEVWGKSIGNGIDNDRDLEIKVSLHKSPAGVMNNLPSPGRKHSGSEGIYQGYDSKTMKSISDEVAEAILIEADRLYASMNPDFAIFNGNSDNGNSDSFYQTNYIPQTAGSYSTNYRESSASARTNVQHYILCKALN